MYWILILEITKLINANQSKTYYSVLLYITSKATIEDYNNQKGFNTFVLVLYLTNIINSFRMSCKILILLLINL